MKITAMEQTEPVSDVQCDVCGERVGHSVLGELFKYTLDGVMTDVVAIDQ